MESFLQTTPKQSRLLNKMLFSDFSDSLPIKILYFKTSSPQFKAKECGTKSHHHNFYEVHFYFDGEAEYVFNEKDIFKIEKNHFILFPPNLPHKKTVNDENTLRFSLAYELVPSSDNSAAYLSADEVLTGLISPDIKDIFMNIVSELDFPSPLTPIILRNFIFNIVYRICRTKQPQCNISDISGVKQQNMDQRVRNAIRFINDNLDLSLSALDVSNHVHISYKQLNRLFLEYLNTTVLKYIHAKKNEKAKELLTKSDMALAEISSSLGFENEYHFNSFFKHKNGISPGAYRKSSKSAKK